jgi:hypothetical protein
MKLSVADRIFLLALDTFPSTGTFIKMGVLRVFMETIQFKPEEIEGWKITEADGNVKWDASLSKNIEVSISETLLGMVIEARDKSGNISMGAVPTFEKFDELKEWFEAERAKEVAAKHDEPTKA